MNPVQDCTLGQLHEHIMAVRDTCERAAAAADSGPKGDHP
jgi:hypothetical protein